MPKNLINWWLSFAKMIAMVNAFILLSLVYLLVITPLGLLRRLMGHNPLKASQIHASWIQRQEPEDLERQF